MPSPPKSLRMAVPSRRSRLAVSGFTLVELLVVLTLVGVLAGVAIGMYSRYLDRARVTLAVSTLDAIRKDFQAFNVDHQQYPLSPVDFVSGTDSLGRRALSLGMLASVEMDVDIVSYTSTANGLSYTLSARAKDGDQTVLTLTPSFINKVP